MNLIFDDLHKLIIYNSLNLCVSILQNYKYLVIWTNDKDISVFLYFFYEVNIIINLFKYSDE